MKDHWPSQQELQERLDYDRISGLFTWKNIRANRYRGKVAGHMTGRYVALYWNGRKLQGQQVAWCYVHGSYSSRLIDHKDGNSRNNAFDNLREATNVQNSQNRRISKKNKSGFKGVSYHAQAGGKNKWRAAIKVGDAIIYLGHFASPEEGHAVYCEAAKKYFGEFARAA